MATAMRRRWGRRGEPAGPTAGERTAAAAGSGLIMVARVVRFAAWGVAAVIVAGILLIVLKANPANDVVSHITDWASTLAGPFDNLFKLHDHKANIGLNWGLAAVVYLIAGSIVAGFIARMGAAPLARTA